MKTLQHIIGLMNKEEVRHLKLFMGRTNAGGDRKDVELFDYIRQHYPDYEEDKIQKKLYKTEDKNALYRLKNRLLEDIGRSMALQYFDDTDFNQVVNSLVLSRLFQSKTQPKVALFYLQKAEKKALAADALELLDIIYSEYIRLSQDTLDIKPAEYIRLRKNNRQLLNRLQEVDDILAEVMYKIRVTQNFNQQDYRLVETLQQKVNEYSKIKEVRSSSQLRIKIYQSMSRIFLQNHDYAALEKYLDQTYSEFSREGLFNRNTHDIKLQMITYLVNALFKVGKFKDSLQWAGKLKTALNEFGGLLHDKYLFYYYNGLVMNYSDSDMEGGRQKAIEVLNEAKESPVLKKQAYNILFVHINLMTLNFDSGNYRQAIKALVKLTMEPSYESLDRMLRFKIAVAELITRYELGDFDILEHRLEQVRKEFSDLQKGKDGKRQQEMLGILEQMIGSTAVKKDKDLVQRITKMLSAISIEEAKEIDLINYNGWLSAKIAG